MKVKVHLKSRHDDQTRVFVLLDASAVEEQFVFTNLAMDGISDKGKPVKPNFPDLTYDAIEAAFKSGVFYARHKVNAKAVAAKLLSFGWEGNLENAIPFAVATTVAIYDAIAGIKSYTENDLSGWDVVDVTRE